LLCSGALAALGIPAVAQTPSSSAPAAASSSAESYGAIAADWGDVIKDAVPQEPTPAVLTQKPAQLPATEDFLNHFYFETRTEYTRDQYSFSGQPTTTGVIDAQPTGTVNPAGEPYPPDFQSGANSLYSYASLGTHGLGSDRINTNFAIRYQSDLTNLGPGSPGLTVVNTFGGNHLFEIMSGNVEINGKPSDGWFANSSLKLGRQTVSGQYPVDFDGASFNRHSDNYSVTFFAGRRFSYYSDPGPRAIGGVDLQLHVTPTIDMGYQGLYYRDSSHTISYRQRLTENWLLNSYFRMIDRHPVDFNLGTFWSSANGRTTLDAAFFAKLSDHDYVFDYALPVVDNSTYNTLPRLYLGFLQPYTQGSFDVRRAFTSYLRLGGGITVRRLNNTLDQGPFDTSFEDYHVSAQVNTWGRTETTFEYHERDSDRLPPLTSTEFGDPTYAGETKVQDLSVELGKSFLENKVSLQGGAFFRRINFQDAYDVIENAQDKGWLGSASYRIDSRTRIFFDYSLDTDFFVWRPSIKNGQIFRLGLDWKY
jgi:hypothetical protein